MDESKILLAHGGGGRMTQKLIAEVFVPAFGNPVLNRMQDAAVVGLAGGKVAFTTDSFVVEPLFFPGGDIGKLSVCGTVNDLAVVGAVPQYISAGFIIEEGFSLADLHRIVESMKKTALQAGVSVVAGDTKVVGYGSADGIFINTAGLGLIPEGVYLAPDRIRQGDRIIMSGNIGEHGLAILARREGLSFKTPVVSDCAPVHQMTQKLLERYGREIRFMRDPTRGGLATVLNEVASQAGATLLLREEELPVSPALIAACGMLGIDPLFLANEGSVVAFVAPEVAGGALSLLHSLPEGRNARIIGEVTGGEAVVLLETELGVTRVLGALEGELLPRIC